MKPDAPREAPSPFEFSAGRLALDFVNTVGGDRAATPREGIVAYADLVRWAREAGIASAPEAGALLALARRRPEEAERARAEALALREALYALFSAEAEAREAPAAPLERVNRALAQALAHRRLVREGGSWQLGWARAPGDLLSPLWPVAADAADLLADHRGRLRLCGGHQALECSWLFLDATKSGTKRWCSMSGCGNRAKARRHYQRKKELAR